MVEPVNTQLNLLTINDWTASKVFFDESRKKLQGFIDEKLPEYQNLITSFDREESKCIVYSGSDKTYGSYHFLDLDKWEMTKLFDLSPWLKEKEMSEMKTITEIVEVLATKGVES